MASSGPPADPREIYAQALADERAAIADKVARPNRRAQAQQRSQAELRAAETRGKIRKAARTVARAEAAPQIRRARLKSARQWLFPSSRAGWSAFAVAELALPVALHHSGTYADTNTFLSLSIVGQVKFMAGWTACICICRATIAFLIE